MAFLFDPCLTETSAPQGQSKIRALSMKVQICFQRAQLTREYQKLSNKKFSWHSQIDQEEWQQIVEASPQGTIFSEQTYLELAGCQYKQFLISQGEEVKAAVCVVCSSDGINCVLDELVIHNGILFLPNPHKKTVRQNYEQFNLTEFAIEQLVKEYQHIEIALSPQFEDMRPFLWHEYNETNANKKFTLDLRYTSYVDISDLSVAEKVEESATFLSLETLRQRHIRDAAKKGATVRRGTDGLTLINYYQRLIQKQGLEVSEEKLSRILNLVDGLVKLSRAKVFEVLNSEGLIVYTVVYIWDSKRAYYLFGAGHPEVIEPWQGTLAHWHAFTELAQAQGVKQIDLEGVNSPKRGWFKQGFGGKLMPYYQVYKGQPKQLLFLLYRQARTADNFFIKYGSD